jgi:hypothetical protein
MSEEVFKDNVVINIGASSGIGRVAGPGAR